MRSYARALDAPERLLRRVCDRRGRVGGEEEDPGRRASLRGEEAEFILAHLALRRVGGGGSAAREPAALLRGIGDVIGLVFDELLEVCARRAPHSLVP